MAGQTNAIGSKQLRAVMRECHRNEVVLAALHLHNAIADRHNCHSGTGDCDPTSTWMHADAAVF